MRIVFAIDGTPDEVKVSCPVWSGGKSGGHSMWLTPHTAPKGLPITIGYYLRRLCAKQPDGKHSGRKPGKQNRPVRHRDQGEER